MHRLTWSMMVGICCIAGSMVGSQRPNLLHKAGMLNLTKPEKATGQKIDTIPAPNSAEKRNHKLPAEATGAFSGHKELAQEFHKTATGGVSVPARVSQVTSRHSTTQDQVAELPTRTEQQNLEDEFKSIDTMDLEQPEGNWLTKRIWWERAKDKYKECREVFEAIFASRMIFLEKRSDIEKNIFDPFYREIGLEQAELRDLLTNLIDLVEEEREESGYIDEKIRTYRDKITTAKKDLEQLKLDIDSINNIDSAIDKSVNTLSNKINEAHRFEQSAWDEFDAIAHELSDKRAYERYYVIDGIHKNLKELQQYIANEFTTYFNGLVQHAQDKTERAKKEVKNLKDHDIDLKEEAKKFVADEQADEDEEAKRAAQIAAQEAKKAAEAAKVGVWVKIWKYVLCCCKSVWNLLFGWLYKL